MPVLDFSTKIIKLKLLSERKCMEIPVFRKGVWYSYHVKDDVPSGWLSRHSYQAASLYATAQSRGYSKEMAESLAEMYIFKQIFEGLQYQKQQEEELKALMT